MVETIFTSPLFVNAVLPFVLIFVLVYAILEKSKVLGDGKNRVNAIISLAIALIFISAGYAVDLINKIVPLVGVALTAILVFLLIWGSVHSDKDDFKKAEEKVKIIFGWIAFLVVAIALIYYTGLWAYIKTNYLTGNFSEWIPTVILVALAVAAVFAVTRGSAQDKKSSS